jgi:hypothetical protein
VGALTNFVSAASPVIDLRSAELRVPHLAGILAHFAMFTAGAAASMTFRNATQQTWTAFFVVVAADALLAR